MLSHTVDLSDLRFDPTKVLAVLRFPVPTDAEDVRSFLGLCSYLYRFFRHINSRLTDILEGDIPLLRGSDRAFQRLIITSITTALILHNFVASAQTDIRIDARLWKWHYFSPVSL